MTIVSLSPKQGQTFLHFRSYLGILPSIISTSAAVAVALQHPQSTRTAKMDPGVASSATASMNESGSEDGSEDKAYRDLLEYRDRQDAPEYDSLPVALMLVKQRAIMEMGIPPWARAIAYICTLDETEPFSPTASNYLVKGATAKLYSRSYLINSCFGALSAGAFLSNSKVHIAIPLDQLDRDGNVLGTSPYFQLPRDDPNVVFLYGSHGIRTWLKSLPNTGSSDRGFKLACEYETFAAAIDPSDEVDFDVVRNYMWYEILCGQPFSMSAAAVNAIKMSKKFKVTFEGPVETVANFPDIMGYLIPARILPLLMPRGGGRRETEIIVE